MNNIMGEKEILFDILNSEKELIKTYSTAVTESSCANMRQVLMNNFKQCAEDQFNVYNAMRDKGYYQGKDAQDKDVQQAKQKYQQLQSQL